MTKYFFSILTFAIITISCSTEQERYYKGFVDKTNDKTPLWEYMEMRDYFAGEKEFNEFVKTFKDYYIETVERDVEQDRYIVKAYQDGSGQWDIIYSITITKGKVQVRLHIPDYQTKRVDNKIELTFNDRVAREHYNNAVFKCTFLTKDGTAEESIFIKEIGGENSYTLDLTDSLKKSKQWTELKSAEIEYLFYKSPRDNH